MNKQFSSLYDMVRTHAELYPRKVAIYCNGRKITYAELLNLVHKVADYLLTQNINPNDKVAITLINCWQYVVSLLAINKIGAVIVPVNHLLKSEELSYIFANAEIKLAFISNKCLDEFLLIQNKPTVVWVNTDSDSDYDQILNQEFVTSYTHKFSVNDTTIIMYTSGTTGLPKGAMLSFKNILSNCTCAMQLMQINDGECNMIAYLPMFHAFTLTVGIFLPLFTASNITIINGISNIGDFKNVLKQLLFRRCRYFIGVPEIYNAMTRAKLPWYFHWFHNVRGFICGAAPLSMNIYDKFKSVFKRGVLIQGYGITECAPIVSCNRPDDNQVGSVGRPFPGYQVEIITDSKEVMGNDMVGEIRVKADCVMQGYYNKPEDTAAVLSQDGWFYTGDLGYLDQDGFLYIVDRKKDIIIRKGMNIYPSEIELILVTHPSVNACAVVGIAESTGSEIPIAYVELREGCNATEQDIKIFLKAHFADFKLPRRVLFMDQLPRNAAGKILKRELRKYDIAL